MIQPSVLLRKYHMLPTSSLSLSVSSIQHHQKQTKQEIGEDYLLLIAKNFLPASIEYSQIVNSLYNQINHKLNIPKQSVKLISFQIFNSTQPQQPFQFRKQIEKYIHEITNTNTNTNTNIKFCQEEVKQEHLFDMDYSYIKNQQIDTSGSRTQSILNSFVSSSSKKFEEPSMSVEIPAKEEVKNYLSQIKSFKTELNHFFQQFKIAEPMYQRVGDTQFCMKCTIKVPEEDNYNFSKLFMRKGSYSHLGTQKAKAKATEIAAKGVLQSIYCQNPEVLKRFKQIKKIKNFI